MAKKKSGIVKAAVGIGAVVVAGKVAYEKYKTTKSRYTKEEQDSADLEVRKYNAICEKKVVEVEDEEFVGCEIKSVASNTTLDLGLAVFEKDVYINFESVCSNVTIILPEGVNVACDIEKRIAGVHNLVENVDEEGIHTVYVIGKATLSKVDIIPVNFYVDDDDVEDILAEDDFKVIAKVKKANGEYEIKFNPHMGLYEINGLPIFVMKELKAKALLVNLHQAYKLVVSPNVDLRSFEQDAFLALSGVDGLINSIYVDGAIKNKAAIKKLA